jgi:uroporphyrinogen decarboxylase
MRQAGRYHKHYQALRAKHSFMEMCKDPHLAAEVAMGPIEDFDFDVAILFSDLLFPLEAMGMGLKYEPAPELGWHLNKDNIKNLKRADEALQGLEFQRAAVIETRKRLPNHKSLIGFVGGPWTLFAYAVEGSHKGGLDGAKKALSLFPAFCEILVPILEANIRLQLEGGAEVVMLFDTAAGELMPAIYRDVVVPSLEKLARTFPKRITQKAFSRRISVIHFFMMLHYLQASALIIVGKSPMHWAVTKLALYKATSINRFCSRSQWNLSA